MDLEEELKAIKKMCENNQIIYGTYDDLYYRRNLLRIKYLAQEFEKTDEEIVNFIFGKRADIEGDEHIYFNHAIDDAAELLENCSDPDRLIDYYNKEQLTEDDYFSKESYIDSVASDDVSDIQSNMWDNNEEYTGSSFENRDGFYTNSEPPKFGREVSDDEEIERVIYVSDFPVDDVPRWGRRGV